MIAFTKYKELLQDKIKTAKQMIKATREDMKTVITPDHLALLNSQLKHHRTLLKKWQTELKELNEKES